MDIKVTAQDSTNALRLMLRHAKEILEPDDTAEIKEHVQGTIATYCALKRARETDQEFLDWYENADLGELTDDDEESPDPTE